MQLERNDENLAENEGLRWQSLIRTTDSDY